MKFPRDLSLSFSRVMVLACLLFHINIPIPVTGQTVDRFITVSTRLILDDSVIQITFPTENKFRYDLQYTTSLSEEFQSLQVIEGNGQDTHHHVVLELSQAFYRVVAVPVDTEPGDPLTTIHGIVHDSNGKPVGGALVRIQGFPDQSGMSREDGSFILPGVPTTSPMIELTAELEETNLSGSITDVKISPGEETYAGIIVLKPSSTNSIRVIDLGGALSAKDAIRLIWIEPGSFLMGSPRSEFGRVFDENQHTVRLSHGYWLGETEVTQAQWHAVMGTNPSEFTGADGLPVEQVSWEDCVNFCDRLTTSERLAGRLPEDLAYTLPTEAQWEYACREQGQSMTPFHFGNSLSADQANFIGSQIGKTTIAGSYSPNALGLYDMHGNLMEWCHDVHDTYPSGAVIDPVGPPLGSPRIARGGSWVKNRERSRSAYRLSYAPAFKHSTLGFRLSLQAPRVPDKENPRYSVTTILGSVADENGNPIQGASVQLRHWPVDAVVSGADGSFAIPDVKVLVTRIGLTAELSGSNPAFGAVSNVILVPDGQTDAGVIVLKPTSPDSMKVIDLDGRLSASDAIRLIRIEPGTFLMGLPPDDPGIIQGEFQYSVTLTQGYWLGETEVSQAQWRAVMTTDPTPFIEGDGLPVEEKSWEDCMNFCARLTERERLAGRLPENMAYTLPTEAQWEFACRERGQSSTLFHFGNTLTTDQANFDNFIGKTVQVGSYTPNALGLHDMHGNVAEWCRDVYGDFPSWVLIDPIGPGEGSSRVVRGGNWHNKSHFCRSDYRSGQESSRPGFLTGFRLSLQPLHPLNPDVEIPTTTIRGLVEDSHGNPVGGASVRIRNVAIDGVVTRRDGSFILNGVPTTLATIGLIAEISGTDAAYGAISNVKIRHSVQTDVGIIVLKPAPPDKIQVIDSGGILSGMDAIRLIWIEPGTFLMGSPLSDPQRLYNEIQHSVQLTQGFWLGETEVTNAQWHAVMGTIPNDISEGGSFPKVAVTWTQCMEFCARLTEVERSAGRLPTNLVYTLPTEAQWEFACRERGQSKTLFHFGNDLNSDQANVARFVGKTTLVGSYNPNALGLYDMHGNVREWCRDVYDDNLIPSGTVVDPLGPGQGVLRVTRGGSWDYITQYCRSAFRDYESFYVDRKNLGFRLSLQAR